MSAGKPPRPRPLTPLYAIAAKWPRLLDEAKSSVERDNDAHGAPSAVDVAEQRLLSPLTAVQRKRLHRILRILVTSESIRRRSLGLDD
jgi:hypothetical protein